MSKTANIQITNVTGNTVVVESRDSGTILSNTALTANQSTVIDMNSSNVNSVLIVFE